MPDYNIYGVLVPAVAVLACISLAMSALLGRLFAKLGLYRHVWHRPLFNVALYIALLGLNVIVYNRYLQ
ncbi:DUF1656 domain-containing protein [uncultured Pseudodesulfovibrio sp.]|uniref:DUF1656 domain-containing protein n=1 Tax=uncultured Pseudodesulfovibrio sp. TaxID=2035858 RepID=UPI0029C7B817|nr:DUF1656 domain-containing protein [uncultured Pseudodesulfovibrio sp.]